MMIADTDEGRQFATRCCRWALEQWRLEVELNFPLLRSISDDSAVHKLAILERWPPPRCLVVGEALVNNRLGLSLGLAVPTEVEALVRSFSEESGRRMMAHFFADMKRGTKLRPEAKKRLRAEVFSAMEPILGSERRRTDPSTWRYTTRRGRWSVYTDVDIASGGPGVAHLSYRHAVYLPEGHVAWMLSALSWMCLDSTTAWTLASEDEIPAAVASLAMACRRFMEAAPVLLP